MTTDQPRRASSTALAAPIPDEAPVMMATLVMAAPGKPPPRAAARAYLGRGPAGRRGAEPGHGVPDLGQAVAAGPGQRDLLGDEQADPAVDVVEVVEHRAAARPVPRRELGEDHRRRHAVLVADQRADREPDRL